jgi:hypothetical protein
MIGFGGLSLTQNGLGDISEAVFVSGNDRFFFIVHGRLPNIFVIINEDAYETVNFNPNVDFRVPPCFPFSILCADHSYAG